MPKDKETPNKKIAFVCTGNTCRSPMAEGIFNKLAADNGLDVSAESFGIPGANGVSASKNAVTVCGEIGVDLSGKVSRSVYDVNLKAFDKFYCMSQSHAAVLAGVFGISGDKIAVMNVGDPYGGDLEVYRQCRDEIFKTVKEILKAYED